MALNPAARYPTAGAVATDIERWLADEPISALPDSLGDRLSRLGRRHRGAVRIGGLALCVIAVLSVVFAILINAERQQEVEIAQRNEELAEKNHDLADQERIDKTRAEENQQLAETRARKLQASLGRNYFERGLREYREGRSHEALCDLMRSRAMLPADDELYESCCRVLLDRCTASSRQTGPPLWHDRAVQCIAFSPDGAAVVHSEPG